MTDNGRHATAEYDVRGIGCPGGSERFRHGLILLRMTSTEFQNQCFELAQRGESKETVG